MTLTDEPKARREAMTIPYMRLLPLEGLGAAALAFEYGAKKYEDRNWELGFPWQQIIDSLRRHLDDFERGTDIDEKSGLPHTAFIAANSLMLATHTIRQIGDDNRCQAMKDCLSAKDVALWIDKQLKNGKYE